jgi:HMG-box domain
VVPNNLRDGIADIRLGRHDTKLFDTKSTLRQDDTMGEAEETHVVCQTNMPINNKRGRPEKVPRSRKPKDMPRRPLSAYNLFFRAERANMLEKLKSSENNDKSDPSSLPISGKIGFETMAKTIGKKWKSLLPDELKVYKLEADRDMQRYKLEMEDYHQSIARRRKVATIDMNGSQEQALDSIQANISSVIDQRDSSQDILGFSHPDPMAFAAYRTTSDWNAITEPSLDEEQKLVNSLHEIELMRQQEIFLQQASMVSPMQNFLPRSELPMLDSLRRNDASALLNRISSVRHPSYAHAPFGFINDYLQLGQGSLFEPNPYALLVRENSALRQILLERIREHSHHLAAMESLPQNISMSPLLRASILASQMRSTTDSANPETEEDSSLHKHEKPK